MQQKDISGRLLTHAFRLKPGDDLKQEIQNYVLKNNIQAGWLACCVGSLIQYNLRFANKTTGTSAKGFFEIVSGVGTVAIDGSHIHLCVSNSEGNTTAGHLLQGNIIYTTAEIILAETTEYLFTREPDGSTAWAELKIIKPV